MKPVRIIGPGSSNADITGYAPKLPRGGETVLGNSLRIGAGGKGLNQMTAAARAGGEVLFITRVGRDPFGAALEAHFDREGFRRDHIRVSEDVATGCALIEIDEATAENRILVIPGANGRVSAADVFAAERDFACADAALTQLEIPEEAVAAAQTLANRYGKPFILNPAPYRPLPASLLAGTDWITPNETEAEALTGIRVDSLEAARAAARRLMEAGVRNALITLGSRGAYWSDGTRELHVESLPVRAVDTTGAGDTFNGALAVAIAEGRAPDDAVRFANCAAALSVTRRGGADSAPTRREIEEQYGG